MREKRKSYGVCHIFGNFRFKSWAIFSLVCLRNITGFLTLFVNECVLTMWALYSVIESQIHRSEGTLKDQLVQLFVGKGAYRRLSVTLSNGILKTTVMRTLSHPWEGCFSDCSHCENFLFLSAPCTSCPLSSLCGVESLDSCDEFP